MSVLSHVLPADPLVIVRKYLGSLSLMSLRSMLLKLLEFITDLDSLDSCHLKTGTPLFSLLQAAVLDLVYCSSRGCPGNLLILGLLIKIFPFQILTPRFVS